MQKIRFWCDKLMFFKKCDLSNARFVNSAAIRTKQVHILMMQKNLSGILEKELRSSKVEHFKFDQCDLKEGKFITSRKTFSDLWISDSKQKNMKFKSTVQTKVW